MPKKLTHDEFKKQLSTEHPELELLSIYNGNKNYITVRCKKHDYTFDTKPNWLHKGQGCIKCYNERRGDNLRKEQNVFIEDAKKIHGDNYDYSKVVYKNNKTKVCIICPKHGEFWQKPYKHLQGQGCPKCAGKYITTEDFIAKAKEIHGDKYDYSKVVYKSSKDKVCIICPKHGEFWQSPEKHIIGEGCHHCNNSKLENYVQTTLLKKGINVQSQKQFCWLGNQKLDFFLPDYNIAIECQGRQHFTSIKHFGGEEGLKKRIKKDITKHFLCEKNNIFLIYVFNKSDLKYLNKKKLINIYSKNNTIILGNNIGDRQDLTQYVENNETNKNKSTIYEKINKIENILKS